ncbi:tyrosine-type recombinase/integrase [Streptomyces sp. NBC_01022]|uniref:tyrosine-type recombinase/integrase n=1 Tax=Streptomyces sp. NBC_01022 TaxID=2903723 RepID=UPI002DDA1D18|nr:tyrosine-type recombinase/integrase [Streptomyces sp. NBC_01022]WRZ81639.1 site-specific integrase [Streptomyces sp. NBC_01022]
MAYVRTNERLSGDPSYTVMWRTGGSRTGQTQRETFDDEGAAKRFRDLVNGHGQQWPPEWVKGEGFVKPGEPEMPDSEKFSAYAHAYVGLLTDISEHTRTNYTRFIDNHMIPWFGDLSVSDRGSRLTRDHISLWILDLQHGRPGPLHPAGTKRRAYAPKTIANLHGLLYSIFQSAVSADPALRDSNPCAHTRLPKGNDTEDDEVFLEPEEYALLKRHVRADAVDIVDALVSTGLRWGEVTALQPRDFTFASKRPTLRVQRAWKRRGEGGTFLGAPKTKKSRRTLVLTPEQVQLFQRRCLGKKPTDLVFTAPEGAAWHSGVFYAHRWKPALDAANAAGLTKRPRVHDLRHTHASWLIAGKVPLPVIQARLGHESITTTVDRYGHLLEASDDEVVAAVEWAMGATIPGVMSKAA